MRSLLACSVVVLAACSPADSGRGSTTQSATSEKVEHVAEAGAGAPAAAHVAPAVIDRGDGLTVEVERAGTGVEVATTSAVTLHYRAFVDGAEKPFDSSYESGVPLDVQLGSAAKPRVIDGLARGLIGLRAGTKAKLKIPAALGWGSDGNESAGVPKDAGLIYEVELVQVR